MNAQKYAGKTNLYGELNRQLSRLEDKRLRMEKKSLRISRLRLLIFLSGTAAFFALYLSGFETASYILAFCAIAAFMMIAHYHSRLSDAQIRMNKWIEIKRQNIYRMVYKWNKLPSSGIPSNEFTDIENDLNIMGEESLFELINLASSNYGKQKLRFYLNPLNVDIHAVRRRNKLIRELLKNMRLVWKTVLASSLSRKKETDSRGLTVWLKHLPNDKTLKPATYFLSILAPINLSLIILNYYDVLPAYWGVTLIIYFGVSFFMGKRVKDLYENASYLNREMSRFIIIFRTFENYALNKESELYKLYAPFKDSKNKPSAYMRRIKRISYILELRGNPMVWLLFTVIAPVDFLLALRFEKYKTGLVQKLPEWAAIWTETEALASLANYAYINPHFIFPEIIDSEEPLIEAEGIGHPLIKDENRVCNNFFLEGKQTALITGSNMSGKSAFLKTLGLNLCLAYSGGPVNAEAFKVSLFDLFTCISVSDSVTDGISYFYAEVKRLKKLLERVNKAGEIRPVFYLIDEIFKGTNNVERNTGSRMFIKSLAGKNSAGLITTHDLELTKLADEIPAALNYHFKDEAREGKMFFDYTIHEGPCPTTNALKIISGEFGSYIKE